MENIRVAIIGMGFVGNAIYHSFKLKGIESSVFDKYKNGGMGEFSNCLESDLIFLALPTLFNSETEEYDKQAIYETCDLLTDNKYSGIVIIKSTIEPKSILKLEERYPLLKFIHNP